MALAQRNYRLSRAAPSNTHLFFSLIAQLLVSSPAQPSPASLDTCGHVTRDLQCSDSCFIFRRVGSTHWPAAAASRVPTRQKQMSYGGPDTIYDSDRHLLSSPLPRPGRIVQENIQFASVLLRLVLEVGGALAFQAWLHAKIKSPTLASTVEINIKKL